MTPGQVGVCSRLVNGKLNVSIAEGVSGLKTSLFFNCLRNALVGDTMLLLSLVLCSFLLIFAGHQVSCQAVDTHGPPKVDRNPLYLDSYIPAGMQIIAHLTELMKYEVTPPKTTTTQAPTTSSHRPGVFSPQKPPNHGTHFDRINTYIKLGEDQQEHTNVLHFNRYHNKLDPNRKFTYGWSLLAGQGAPVAQEFEAANEDLDLLGKIPNDLYKLLNTIEDYSLGVDEDVQVLRFSEKYDDSDIRYLLRQKKIPPTRAYVTLLSLYDNLNKESKTLGLNKYSGYTREVLKQLAETSTGTSANQLRIVLSKIVERRDTKAPDITKKINQLIGDLNQSDSYLNDALRYIPPLAYNI